MESSVTYGGRAGRAGIVSVNIINFVYPKAKAEGKLYLHYYFMEREGVELFRFGVSLRLNAALTNLFMLHDGAWHKEEISIGKINVRWAESFYITSSRTVIVFVSYEIQA